jgi:hypothetical protein
MVQIGETNATLRVASDRAPGLQPGLQTAPFSLRDGLSDTTGEGYSKHQSKSPFESLAGEVLPSGDSFGVFK